MSSTKKSKRELSPAEREKLFQVLQARFETHPMRHPGLQWSDVQARLEQATEKLWSLHEMERSGGEPDVVSFDGKNAEFTFMDCSPESPKGRAGACYDRAGWESRKEHRPESNAVDRAAAMGIDLLTEAQYRDLQKLGEFDAKTSSWIKTPEDIRAKGGALFCDRRYGHVFVYHNGAQSYYSGRGFRGWLKI